MKTTAVFLGALLAGPLSAAQAASPLDLSLPAESVAGCDGPLCLLLNPAGLRWSGRVELLAIHDQRFATPAQPAGNAAGLLMSTRNFGLGVEYVQPDRDAARLDHLVYTLGVNALSLGTSFALGAGLQVIDPTETNEDLSVDFLVGALVRPLRYLSLGVVGRNLARPTVHGVLAPPAVDFSLAARPLWFAPERLTLSADLSLVADASDPPLRFTLAAMPLQGFGLLASADLEGRLGVGFTLDLAHVGLGGFTRLGTVDGLQDEGFVLTARASFDPRPGLPITSAKTVELSLGAALVREFKPVAHVFRRPRSLWDLEQSIQRAAQDDQVDSLLLKVDSADLGLALAQELRDALLAFRARGKKVLVHLDRADSMAYYLASAADAISLSPATTMVITGPKVEALFFGGTLELLGVRAEAVRVGKYKSAVERFTRKDSSEAAREVMHSLSDEFAGQFRAAIAEGRRLAPGRVQALVDEGLLSPTRAQQAGLVDYVLHYDEIQPRLTELIGHAPARSVGFLDRELRTGRWGGRPTLAVVHATGTIQDAPDLTGGMNGRAVEGVLEALRRDTSVDAVVLRVDSPGGSGEASDRIWHQVRELRKQKPVIVSMGALAASGGYYVACPADWIVADPATITGSIGVFTLLVDASKLYAKLGVNREAMSSSKRGDLYTSFHGRSDEELRVLQAHIDDFYTGFVDRVAEGRHMKPPAVDSLAQGRVWTGRQAKERGLVDELGGLSRALALARERLGLPEDEPVRVIHLPADPIDFRVILRELGLWVEAEPLTEAVAEVLRPLQELVHLARQPVLAMLPWLSIEVH